MNKFGQVLNKSTFYGIIKDKFLTNGSILKNQEMDNKDHIIVELVVIECMEEILQRNIYNYVLKLIWL